MGDFDLSLAGAGDRDRPRSVAARVGGESGRCWTNDRGMGDLDLSLAGTGDRDRPRSAGGESDLCWTKDPGIGDLDRPLPFRS